MKKNQFYSVIILVFWITQGTWAQEKTVIYNASFQPKIEKARAYIHTIHEKLRVPGVSIAVGVGGQLIWAEGFGYADTTSKTPVTPNSMFLAGSISKNFTAAAAGLLYEKGKLDMDAPIQQYVPYYPQKKYPLTIRQLAGHQGGIRHYISLEETLSNQAYESVKASISIIQNDTLLFEPGTKYFYSTYGYNLIAAAIEGVSGKDYLTFMKSKIFKPLKMKHTVPGIKNQVLENPVSFYHFMPNGQLVVAPQVDLSNKWAGGGFLTTPTDLILFVNNLSKLLKTKTIALLTTPQRLKNGEATNYGMGWRNDVIDKTNNRIAWHHGGASVGGRAFLFHLPKEQITVAFTANAMVNFAEKEAYEIAQIFLGEK